MAKDTTPDRPAQLEMLRAYKAYYDEHGEPPTVRWLADKLEKSVTRIQVMLAACKHRGDIQHVTIIRPIPAKPKRRIA